MENFIRSRLSLLSTLLLVTVIANAQAATISPTNATVLRIGASVTQSFTITTSGMGNTNNDRTFAYTITGPVSFSQNFSCANSCNTQSHSLTFTTPGTYTVSVVVTQTQGGNATASTSTTLSVYVPNLYSTSGTGPIQAYNVNPVTGGINAGPATVLATPSGSTAALGLNAPALHLTLPAIYITLLIQQTTMV
ncbi:MAG: hypothetical protein ACK4E8_03785 [Lacibacter sp.]